MPPCTEGTGPRSHGGFWSSGAGREGMLDKSFQFSGESERGNFGEVTGIGSLARTKCLPGAYYQDLWVRGCSTYNANAHSHRG